MAKFGERLRREREMRGVTLDEIAAATKIGTRSLRALEEEDFSKLPGGIFNKGFVRAYAKFLGIDEDQAVADYVAAAGEQEQSSEAVIEKLAAESERRAEEKRIQRQRDNAAPPFTWNGLAIAVVLVVAAVLGWQYHTRQQALTTEQAATRPATTTSSSQPVTSPATTPDSASQPSALANSIPATESHAPTQLAPTQPQTVTPEAIKPSRGTAAQRDRTAVDQLRSAITNTTSPAGDDQFVVKVKARKTSWLSSEADGDNRSQRMLPPNAEATFHARSSLKLVVGNAGGVEISFNGKPLPLLGEENKSRTLVFSPDGLQ